MTKPNFGSARPACQCDEATPEELDRLRSDGFFTRAGYFAPRELEVAEALADQAVAYHNGFPAHLQDVYKQVSRKDGVTFVNELADDSGSAPALRRFAHQPRIARMARSVAGPQAAHHCYQIVYKHPGFMDPFPWHQDHIHTPVDRPFYNVWIALSDMTVENGCLWMLPGVALGEVLEYSLTPYGHTCWPLAAAEQGIPVELERGSIVVITSHTLHKSGGNATAGYRKAMLVAFMDRRATAADRTIPLTPYEPLPD